MWPRIPSEITINLNVTGLADGRLDHIISSLKILERKVDTFMATQAELAQQLTTIGNQVTALDGQVTKVQTEQAGLKAEIVRLNDIIAQGGPITQELQDAAAGLVTKVTGLGTSIQTLDDMVPDPPQP
jgi:uncharacterized protein involved in exopolysaccharide biosynthesis